MIQSGTDFEGTVFFYIALTWNIASHQQTSHEFTGNINLNTLAQHPEDPIPTEKNIILVAIDKNVDHSFWTTPIEAYKIVPLSLHNEKSVNNAIELIESK